MQGFQHVAQLLTITSEVVTFALQAVTLVEQPFLLMLEGVFLRQYRIDAGVEAGQFPSPLHGIFTP
jgi:hypothetical protein